MRARQYISHQAAHLHVAHERAPLVAALPVRGLRPAGNHARDGRPESDPAVYRVSADNAVTAVDLVFSCWAGEGRSPASGCGLTRCAALLVLVSLRLADLVVLGVFGWLALLARSDRAKDAGILIVRPRVAVLGRRVKDASAVLADRAVLAALARLLTRGERGQLALITCPRTLLRWHARLVRRHWTHPRRPAGRPGTVRAVRALVREMARDNPGRGYRHPRRADRARIQARPAGGRADR